MNYAAVTKEIWNDFLAGEARTDIAVRSFTEDGITVRSVGIVYNQHKLNLEILQQVYQLNRPARMKILEILLKVMTIPNRG